MNTIGQILKTARLDNKISLADLEKLTKIKISFIENIEQEKWEALPPFPTVLGFVKSLSTVLDLDQTMAVAVLKRDYPPKKLSVNPKPDVASKFSWNPKITFIMGVVAVLLVIFGYLAFQYQRFVSPPRLRVDSPKDGQMVSGSTVLVFGSTNADAKVTVNNQTVIVTDDGKFSTDLPITEKTTEVVVKATSRTGKETVIQRTIVMADN